MLELVKKYLQNKYGSEWKSVNIEYSLINEVFKQIKQADNISNISLSGRQYLANFLKLMYITYTPFKLSELPIYLGMYIGYTYTKNIKQIRKSVFHNTRYHKVFGHDIFEQCIIIINNIIKEIPELATIQRPCYSISVQEKQSDLGILRLSDPKIKKVAISVDLYTNAEFNYLFKRKKPVFTHISTGWVFPKSKNSNEEKSL